MAAKKKAAKKRRHASRRPQPLASPGRFVASRGFPADEVHTALESHAFAVRVQEMGSDKQYIVEIFRQVPHNSRNTDAPENPQNVIIAGLVKACLQKAKWKGHCNVLVYAVPFLGRYQEAISTE